MSIYEYMQEPFRRIRVKSKISKSNQSVTLMQARLDEVRMSGHRRLEAQAQLARAEAMVDFLSAIAAGAKRVLRKLVLRPYHKLTASLG